MDIDMTEDLARLVSEHALATGAGALGAAGATAATSHWQTDYAYDALGQLSGATGSARGTARTTNADGTVTETTWQAVLTYAVVWGEAVVTRLETTSTTIAGAITVQSEGVTDYVYNQLGQLTDASGRVNGTTRVQNADGTVAEASWQTVNTYLIVWGFPLVGRSVTDTR